MGQGSVELPTATSREVKSQAGISIAAVGLTIPAYGLDWCGHANSCPRDHNNDLPVTCC